MFNSPRTFLFLAVLLTSCSAHKMTSGTFSKTFSKAFSDPGIEEGVSHNLAIYRHSVISSIHYALDLDIPVSRNAAIEAKETISFQLNNTKLPLQIDFKEDPAKIKELHVNGQVQAINYQKEHLIINSGALEKGKNEVSIVFEAGDGALNRNADYLYTLFVPDRARTVFPCFDQPDLKATYGLTLHIPVTWHALANAVLQDSVVAGDRKTYRYRRSDKVSTYLFAFAAGNFKSYTGKTNGQAADFLFRETDPEKFSQSLQKIFDLHTSSLKYYEGWTGIVYPFQKFGFVAIPDFQFGGMEHPGTIQYKSNTLFLDGGATQDQLNARSNLIAHETAHMWFGDLVTMSWFTDVWMKEVFANFMADKSLGAADDAVTYNLKFLIDHVPSAYSTDRTPGANPIRQPLDNLQDAGTLYGNIIYHKAPVMMQQLEQLMGKVPFQKGVRQYLRTYANDNASWPQLISILDHYTPADLQQWNKVWVDESGRPVISYDINYNGDKISQFSISQAPEYGTKRIWQQFFEVALFYTDSVKLLNIDLSAAKQDIPQAVGLAKPLFVLFNTTGLGYAQWPVDPKLPRQLSVLKSPLHRATAYISLYEQVLSGKTMKPEQLLTLFSSVLPTEQEELNVKLLSGYISNLYWQFLKPERRVSLSLSLENEVWRAMSLQKSANNKKQLFKAYQDIFMNAAAEARMYKIWKTQAAPEGIKLSEDDYTNLSMALALRDNADTSILTIQHARIKNPDRKNRFEFIMPALSSNVQQRDQFFSSLEQKKNREKESNVLAALYYLHHPLRQETSIHYLEKSLSLLEEIQRSGDIFFPQSWLQLNFGMYQSAAAVTIVNRFLEKHPDYNPKLKAKILQTTDNLFRAQRMNSEL